MNNLCECSQHALDVFGCADKATNIPISQSLNSVLASLSTEVIAKNIECRLFICDPEPRLLVNQTIWHTLLKQIIRDEFLYAMHGAEISISVVSHSRVGCIYGLELTIAHWTTQGSPSCARQDGENFSELAQGFSQQLLARILGIHIRRDLEGMDRLQKRTLTATLPVDLISTSVVV